MIGEISNAFLTKNVPNGGRAFGLAFSHRKINANGVTQPCRRDTPGSFRVPAGAQSVVRLTRRDARLAPGVASEGKSVPSLTGRDARLTPSDASEGKSVASLTPSEARDSLGFEGGRWVCHEAGFCRLHGC